MEHVRGIEPTLPQCRADTQPRFESDTGKPGQASLCLDTCVFVNLQSAITKSPSTDPVSTQTRQGAECSFDELPRDLDKSTHCPWVPKVVRTGIHFSSGSTWQHTRLLELCLWTAMDESNSGPSYGRSRYLTFWKDDSLNEALSKSRHQILNTCSF